MMTDDDIYAIGMMLEEKGLSHSEIDQYFEHAGIKGMKWGVRSRSRASSDRAQRYKAGKPTARDKITRALDLDSGHKRAKTPSSTAQKVGAAATGVLLAAYGTLTLAAIKMR